MADEDKKLMTSRLTDDSAVRDVDNGVRELEAALRLIFGIPADTVMAAAMAIDATGAVELASTLAFATEPLNTVDEIVTGITSGSTNSQLPTAFAVEDRLGSLFTGGTVTAFPDFENFPTSMPGLRLACSNAANSRLDFSKFSLNAAVPAAGDIGKVMQVSAVTGGVATLSMVAVAAQVISGCYAEATGTIATGTSTINLVTTLATGLFSSAEVPTGKTAVVVYSLMMRNHNAGVMGYANVKLTDPNGSYSYQLSANLGMNAGPSLAHVSLLTSGTSFDPQVLVTMSDYPTMTYYLRAFGLVID